MTIKFGMFGNGRISERHKEAIKHIGGQLMWISDPAFNTVKDNKNTTFLPSLPTKDQWNQIDYAIICSPTPFHREQCKLALKYNKQVICEKPLCLPWEPLIDDDRINICLQLRYIKGLPQKADIVRAVMVRDDNFFKSWKGDFLQAGGNIYEFFIHYVDLAIRLNADFQGAVLPSGEQERKIFFNRQNIYSHLDIMIVNMQNCYNRMYERILECNGIKPKDVFHLMWVLNRYTDKYMMNRYGEINIPAGFLKMGV